MSPQVAFIAGFEHAGQDRTLLETRAFWLGAIATRNLISEGRLEEAAPILREMLRSAKFLLVRYGARRVLGRRMLETAKELFRLLIAARDDKLSDIAQ